MAEPIVEVQQGKLKGKTSVDIKGKSFYSFQGIPYAKPPVGELRFKAPLPAEPWTGIRDATQEGSESVSNHMIFMNKIGTEDCLNLNVYTSQLPNGGAPKAVMVWIHGGGFTLGSNKTEIYGPEFLVAEDIVLVTINYRLGILGFLSLEDTSLGVPGNAGLKDMVLALHWVQKNIKQFNGDPNNVTIFGESAGSAACNYLVLSPSAKGLFHRAILQSGASINPWACGQRNAIQIAQALGKEAKNEKEALEFLKTVPAEKFLDAQEIIKDPFQVNLVRPFGPVIEKPNPEAFLTENPLDIIRSGNFNKVPIMLGYTSQEGMLIEIYQKMYKKTESTDHKIKDFEETIPAVYNIPKGSDLSKKIAKQIEEFYYADTKSDMIDKYFFIHSDTFFVRGIQVTMKNMLKTSNQPIYFYRFNIETKLNVFKNNIAQITHPGVCHGDDLGYLFKNILTPEIAPGSLEEISMHRVVKFWTNFAKTGNPNPASKDSLINIEWPKLTADNISCLNIDKELTITKDPEAERMKFWDDLAASNGIEAKF